MKDFLLEGALLLAFCATMGLWIMGGDSAEYDRKQAIAEQQVRIARACTPDQGQRIVVVRESDFIHFTYIDIGPGRYAKTFPHVEVRLATLEDM